MSTVNPQTYHNPVTGYKYHFTEIEGKPYKFIDHPGVYLVGSMQLHHEAIGHYLRDHQITQYSPLDTDGKQRGTDSDILVELSGRVCYMSYDKPRPGGLDAFIRNLKEEGHGSVFEHPHYSFILTGVSRNLTLEANRHRTFNISQLSGRFVDGEAVGFVIDPDIEPGEQLDKWKSVAVGSMREYVNRYEKNEEREFRMAQERAGIERGVFWMPDSKTKRKITKRARERARDILPGALETRVLYTVNARAIRFIFEKRCHADAAWEIRRAFNGVYNELKKLEPRLFADYIELPLDDGTFAVQTDYGKV